MRNKIHIFEGCTVRLRGGKIVKDVKRGSMAFRYWVASDGDINHTWFEGGNYSQIEEHANDIVEVVSRDGVLPSTTLKVPMPDVQPPKAVELRKRRIYLSGPMKGLPDHNVPAFNRAAETLRALGHEVMNPGEHQNEARCDLKPVFLSYCEYIIHKADMLVILPGWENSKGVAAEKALAEVFNLEIRYL